MSLNNFLRKNCHDVYNSFLVRTADYKGFYDYPVINPTHCVPNRIIPFSKALSSNEFDQWIHFYEDDYLFEKLWNNPKRYLKKLSMFNGVILPDFSLYRDMPFSMQLWNIYRSRAIGCWLQQNNITVIPNIRYGDKRTYDLCCDGLSQGGVIAIGTHGTVKNKRDRMILIEGLPVVINRLKPESLVIYGTAPGEVFDDYKRQGIRIINFESEFSKAMNSRKEMI